ncbi:MAG: ATP-binding protein [Halobacteriota archaeon]|nr:ATP-binding protein [Halobacteriota archaeon]
MELHQQFTELEKSELDCTKTEEALLESESKMHSLFENTPDQILIVDRQHRIQFVNRTVPPLKMEDMIGTCIDRYTQPEYRDEYSRKIDQVFETGEACKIVSRGVGVGNRFSWFENRIAPIKPRGKVTSAMVISTDITERKRVEEELVRKEKLAMLGQLAGSVSHELRNPLGAIKNATYFLNMVIEEPDSDVKESLEIIEKEVARSDRIIGSILGFARPKPPNRKKVDVNEIVQVALAHVGMPENIELIIELDDTMPSILADPDQLDQVFGNIIINAMQAMPRGGRLKVRSRSLNEWLVTISFTDTGMGIPDKDLKMLFEPLYSTKAKGIGLGLAISKAVMEAHGGTIDVKSVTGEGSTFTVRLPHYQKEITVK